MSDMEELKCDLEAGEESLDHEDAHHHQAVLLVFVELNDSFVVIVARAHELVYNFQEAQELHKTFIV